MTTMIQTPVRFGAWTGTAYLHEHRWWVPARPICESLGLSWSRQRRVLTATPTLSVVALKATTEKDGKGYEMLMVPTGKIGLWLAGIRPSRVAESARPALIAMQAGIEEAIARQVNEAFGIPAPADLSDLLARPVAPGEDRATVEAERVALLSQPQVGRAAQLFALGLPGTKAGLLVGASAYRARKWRRRLEGCGVLDARKPAPEPQPDLFGEGEAQ